MNDIANQTMSDNDAAPPVWFQQWLASQRFPQASATDSSEQVPAKNVSNDVKPRKALPTLMEYHGESDKFDAWIQQARAKILIDYEECSEFVKFWTLNGALRGKAVTMMEGWVGLHGTVESASSDAMLTHMRNVFRDPQAKERAQKKTGSVETRKATVYGNLHGMADTADKSGWSLLAGQRKEDVTGQDTVRLFGGGHGSGGKLR